MRVEFGSNNWVAQRINWISFVRSIVWIHNLCWVWINNSRPSSWNPLFWNVTIKCIKLLQQFRNPIFPHVSSCEIQLTFWENEICYLALWWSTDETVENERNDSGWTTAFTKRGKISNNIIVILTFFHYTLRLRALDAFVRCSSEARTVNGNSRIRIAY